MKRVLVTGAGGQLGRSIQDIAPEHGSLHFRFYDRTGLDITDADQVQECFKDLKPDYCINCAAYTSVDQAEKTPDRAYEVNVRGVENLVRACRNHEVILMHISTDYVFDGKKEEGYWPGDPTNPINVYGRTKLKGEETIQEHLERYFIIRTSWLYSRKYAPNFYLTILDKARKGESLTVTDSQRGCPTDAANLAAHLVELIEAGGTNYGISHFTDGEAMSWHGFATRILERHGLTDHAHLSIGENYVTFAERPENSILR